MILIKPKISTLFSLGVFVTICLATAGYGGYRVLSGSHEWYFYAMLIVPGPLGAGILFRQIFGYKLIQVAKARIHVKYPFRFSSYSQTLKDIRLWKETKIKTSSGFYREAEIFFTNG